MRNPFCNLDRTPQLCFPLTLLPNLMSLYCSGCKPRVLFGASHALGKQHPFHSQWQGGIDSCHLPGILTVSILICHYFWLGNRPTSFPCHTGHLGSALSAQGKTFQVLWRITRKSTVVDACGHSLRAYFFRPLPALSLIYTVAPSSIAFFQMVLGLCLPALGAFLLPLSVLVQSSALLVPSYLLLPVIGSDGPKATDRLILSWHGPCSHLWSNHSCHEQSRFTAQ